MQSTFGRGSPRGNAVGRCAGATALDSGLSAMCCHGACVFGRENRRWWFDSQNLGRTCHPDGITSTGCCFSRWISYAKVEPCRRHESNREGHPTDIPLCYLSVPSGTPRERHPPSAWACGTGWAASCTDRWSERAGLLRQVLASANCSRVGGSPVVLGRWRRVTNIARRLIFQHF